jgi:SagB-type dehydrogenase family enzyme
MTWIDLGNPRPHNTPRQYTLVDWPDIGLITLPVPKASIHKSFIETVMNRRSRRIFKPVDKQTLADILWLSASVQARIESNFGFDLELRPVSSGGAIHPIHILINFPENNRWYRYDTEQHVLRAVQLSAPIEAGLNQCIDEIMPRQEALAMLFLAEPGKTFAKYENTCSLIWRDAGIILGHLTLVAEAYALNFCPLGITGEPWASQLCEKGNLVGVGMALLGTR